MFPLFLFTTFLVLLLTISFAFVIIVFLLVTFMIARIFDTKLRRILIIPIVIDNDLEAIMGLVILQALWWGPRKAAAIWYGFGDADIFHSMV